MQREENFEEQDQIVSKFATFLYRVFEYKFEHYSLICV